MEVPRPQLFQETYFRLQSQWPVRKFFGLLLECPPEAARFPACHDPALPDI